MTPKYFIGPMSKNVVDTIIEFCNETNSTIGLIPSRRQVEWDGGYVNNWTTKEFTEYVRSKTNKILLVRDHSGPKQGQVEDDGYFSLGRDCDHLDIIHIDPWKQHQVFSDGLEETIKMIKYCYTLNPNIQYEVGTEEAIRRFEPYELNDLIHQLKFRLDPENFYKYKKAEGKLFSKSVKRKTFLEFLDWSDKNLWVPKHDADFKTKCFNFYITKTKKRIAEYLKNNPESDHINGEYIPDVYDLLDIIDTEWLCDGLPSQFHGDFILDNIIETTDSFCLIDWRQDFAGDLEIGDIYYDLAKLNHNLTVNHDIVGKNLFNPSSDNCYILTNSTLNECRELLHSFIKENLYDLKKVNILTSLIWINMAPLHEYPFSNFLFNFGKYNLYQNLKP